MNDLNPFEFPEMSWVSTGADSQDRLKYHFHSYSGCFFAMSLSKPPVNPCWFFCVIRANPISGDLYIHSQAFLSIGSWWGLLLWGCYLYVTVNHHKMALREQTVMSGLRVKAIVNKEPVYDTQLA